MPPAWKLLLLVLAPLQLESAPADSADPSGPGPPSAPASRDAGTDDFDRQPPRAAFSPRSARPLRNGLPLPVGIEEPFEPGVSDSAARRPAPAASHDPPAEAEASGSDDRRAMKLPPPSPSFRRKAAKKPAAPTAAGSLATVGGGLAIVLGLFFLLVVVARRTMPKSAGVLPAEVVEVLGRAPLAGRQQMHLVRVGRKLLLVSVSPGRAETLTEITDPEEVEHLATIVQQQKPTSATATFRQVLGQLGADPAPGGFWGQGDRTNRDQVV